uniref:endo alpha-1,4 polygalactosaminidase n=1 Tax=Nonlabens sp. Ci31 TaxID=2608253 RepID=UPI0014766371|nr:endo alpha-1,4 polygalactosaminidase [Nonlabens sp. Ci31]
MTLLSAANLSHSQKQQGKILFCYGDFYPQDIKGYDYVIVEPTFFNTEDVQTLKSQNKHVLAYISLGEVNEAASHYDEVKNETIGVNKQWNSHTLDISAPATINALKNQIEDHLAVKKFDGLFLDNIDNYTEFGSTPQLKDSLVGFLKGVKSRFRESVIMQNAGLFIIEDLRPLIDLIAVESVATNYNFEKDTYQLRDKKDYKERLDRIKEIQKLHKIPIILIEYADTEKLKKKIKSRLKASQFDLFIGQIDLQKTPRFKK